MVGLRNTLLFLSVLGSFLTLPSAIWGQTAPSFTSSPTVSGTYGSSYTYSIATDDAEGDPREILLSSGVFPSGLVLTDNGDGSAILQGSPQEAGSFAIELKVRETASPFMESTQSFTLDISKVILTVTADDQSRAYGQSNPSLTFSFTGFVNGDDETDLTTLPIATTSATVLSTVGNYMITVADGADDMYDFTYVPGNLTITKKMLAVTADNKTFVYGQTVPVLTLSYTGFVNGEDQTDLDTPPGVGTAASSSSNAGLYAIVPFGGMDDNYSFQLVNGQATITKATLTITAEDQSKVYGAVNPSFSLSYSGFVNGDDETDIDAAPVVSTIATNASDAGNYAITLTGGIDDNYSLQLIDGQLVITKTPLTATALNAFRNYGAPNPAFALTYSGFVNGDDESDLDAVPVAITSAIVTSNTGTYSITLSGGLDNNYTFNYTNGVLTVNKAQLTVTAADASRVYGQANPAFSVSYSGFLNGDNLNALDQEPVAGTIAAVSSNAGTYSITVSGGLDNNYDFLYVNGTLTVTKATATMLVSGLLQNVNGLPRPVTVQTIPTGLTVTVLYDGSTTVPSAKGTYAILATINDINYQGWASATYLLNGAPVLSTLPIITMSEDGASQTINFSLYVEDTEQSDATLLYEVRSISNPSLFQQASIAGTTLTLSLNPDKYGTSSIVMRFTDSQGLFVEGTLSVTVNNVQDAPVFTSPPVVVAAQDVLYSYMITAQDVDLTDALTITSNIALPSWLTLVNQGNGTATLSGTPLQANIGVVGIALKVTDDKGNFANQFFNITVLEGQFPPQFTSTPVTTARESINYSYTAITSDFNGGPIIYSATTLPSWITAATTTSGDFVLTGKPSLSHVYDLNGYVDFPVTIRATDNTGLFSTQSFSVRVLYENSPPTISLPFTQLIIDEDSSPTDIALTGITDGGEIGQVISITTSAEPDAKLQATVHYQSPQTAGTLRIEPLPDANGTVILSVRVQDDGKGSKNFIVKPLTITIKPVNDKPLFTSVPVTRVNAGAVYSYALSAADPDTDDDLVFELIQAPAWLQVATTSARQGLLTGVAPFNETNAVVNIRVKDETGEFSVQTFVLIVNKAPVLQDALAETAEDVALAFPQLFFQQLITDPNDDVPEKIKITQLPTGNLRQEGRSLTVGEEIMWNSLSQLTYTPPLDYFGSDSFAWNASDGLLYGEEPSQVEISVVTANDPPELRNIETSPITYSQGDNGVTVSNQLTVVDVDDINLMKARVSISEFYDEANDELFYEKPSADNSNISAAFDRTSGVLMLEGEASKSAYENALRNVKYRNTFLGTTDQLSRSISMQAFDVSSASAIVQRDIFITRVLPDIELVEAFTPNGDGVNEVWDFKNLDAYNDIRVMIYDTTGRRVYDCADNTCAWDGKYNGAVLPAGPYLYTIDLDKGRRTYKGTVTLLR
jgi:gliding motility-associated-like protein